jgi:hypothetical protein
MAVPIKSMAQLTYSNPVVFFDISIGGVPQGRMKFELYADRVPKYFPPNPPPKFKHTYSLEQQKTSGNFALVNSKAQMENQWATKIPSSTAQFTPS